jgi:PAS domain S-box-containing protein
MKLLFVEASAADAELTLSELRRFGFDPGYVRVESMAALTAALSDGAWSAVISDYRLPGFTAMDALRVVRERDREVPFLVVSGMVGEECAVEIIQAGANDYIMKDRLHRLGPALTRELRDVQLRHERRVFFEALRRSEERHRRIFEQAPIGVATCNAEGNLLSVNQAFASMLRFRPEQMVGQRLSRFVHPDDRHTAPAQQRYERRFLTIGGEVVWTTVTASPVLAEDQQVVWLIEDISDRKRQERELERRAEQQIVIANLSHAALRGESIAALVEQVSVAISTFLDADLCVTLREVDGRFRVVGGSGWAGGTDFDTTTATMASYTMQTGAPVIVPDFARETRFRTPQYLLRKGVVSSINVPIGTGRGETWGVLATHFFGRRQFTEHDVEFLRAMATVLAQAIERDRADHQLVLYAAQQSAIAELGRIALKSVAEATENACTIVQELLGVEHAVFSATASAESVPGKSIAVPVASGNEHFGVLTAYGKRDGAFDDADASFVQSLASILAESMVREQAAQALAVSVTQLEQADRLTSLGRMAATIAHEFNNVLMGISPFVEVIRRGKSVEMSLDHIGRAVKRGKRITEEILRFTRHAPPQRAAFEVEPWIENIALEARSLVPPSCRIDTFVQADDLAIDGDANQLQQIFTNLILNARDAMPNGGSLTIEVRRERPNARWAFGIVDRPERFVHCIVSDTGCGMSADTLRHIYEPLFTTRKNGTGLGLAVTHQVVQRHGGEIFVESTVGVGTTFHLFLPLAAPGAKTNDALTSIVENVMAISPRHVLLVEDDAAVAMGLVTLLELRGLRVDVVETGAAAIRALDTVTPDLVLLDVGLPDMEGTAVYETIAARLPRLPVIFSTGHADRARLDAVLEKPNVAYLLKPYESNALLRTIEDVLAGNHAA